MARRLATATTAVVALLLAAAASAMPMFAGKAYCAGTDFKLLTSDRFLSLWTEGSASDCKRVYQYGIAPMGNVTLNEVASESCYSREAAVNWMNYNGTTDTVAASIVKYNPGFGATYLIHEVTLSVCAESTTSSVMATGQYCSGPTTSLTAHGDYFLWTQPDPLYGWCALAGEYDLSSSYSLSFSDRATSCSTSTLSVQRNFYDASNKELWIQYYGAGISNQGGMILAQSTCNSTQGYLPQWASYCVDASAAASDYQSSVFMSQNMSNLQVIAPNAGRGIDCHSTYNYSMWNGQIALNLTSDNTCSGYAPNLFGAKYFSSNDSFVFQTYDRDWFTASRCAATAGLVNGTYCGGENAQMQVAGQTVSIWSDWADNFPRCRVNAQWRWTEGGAIISMVESTCGASEVTLTMNGTTVYVTYQRSNGIVEGYAFEQDFCGTATAMPVQALPVPAGKYCMNVESAAGASGMFIVQNRSFVWTVNTTNTAGSWINYRAPCAFAGHVSHRNGQVSYRVLTASCASSSYTPDIRLYNMTFVNGALTFMLNQEERTPYANMTVTTSMCPASTGSLLPAAMYCPAFVSAYDMSQMYVINNTIVFYSWSENCVTVGRMNWRTDDMIYLTTEINGCQSTSSNNAFGVLGNGDLYVYGSSNYGSGGVLSSSTCGASESANPTFAAGTYCGTFAASSGATPAPTAPAPAPTNTSSLHATQTSTTMSAKLTLAIGNSRIAYWIIEPENDTPCVVIGGLAPSATAFGFGVSYATSNCAYWQIKQILRNPSTNSLTVSIQQNSYAWVNATLSLNSCAAWEVANGIASGEYCPAQGAAGTVSSMYNSFTTPFLAAGSTAFWYDLMNAQMIVANFSGTQGTNATFANQWWTYVSSSSSSTSLPYTIALSDRYVNKVGTTGVAVSSKRATLAFTQGQCSANSSSSATSSIPSGAMSSEWIDALGGRVTAVFDQGAFFLQWNGTSRVVTVDERVCFASGYYMVNGNQLTLYTIMNERSNCGETYEFGPATVSADGATITLPMWFGAAVDVTLTTANCHLINQTAPAGRYCAPSSASGYLCNDRAFFVVTTETVTPVGTVNVPGIIGIVNVSTNANGTMAFVSQTSSYLNYPFSGSLDRWSLAAYNTQTQLITFSDYQSRGLRFASRALCEWPAAQRATDLSYPLVGAYCGYASLNATSKMTFFALPGGQFFMHFYPNVSASLSGVSQPECYMSGSISFSNSTSEVYFQSPIMTSGCSLADSANSDYADARVQFTRAAYDNKTVALSFWGYAWPNASTTTPTPIMYTARPGTCDEFAMQNQTIAVLTPNLPTGLYQSTGAQAGVVSTVVVVGAEYAVGATRNSANGLVSHGTVGGYYVPVVNSSRARNVPFVPYAPIALGTIGNSTFNTNNTVLDLNLLFSYSSTTAWLTLPYGYSNSTPAQTAATGGSNNNGGGGAAAGGDADKDDDKKTGIIIGVIVAVIVVAAVIGIVVTKSRSNRGSGQTENRGGDYQQMMNTV